MKVLANKENITSLELLEQINLFRGQENRKKLQHKDLLKIIRNEFDSEVSQGKISPRNYINRGREYVMYSLTLSQAKQVLIKESKYVRKAVIQYIEILENQVKQLNEQIRLEKRKKGIWVRNEETKAMASLIKYGNVPKERERIYYMNFSKIPKKITGFAWKKRDELTPEQLDLVHDIELVEYSKIIENILDQTPFTAIYNNVLEACKDYYINASVTYTSSNLLVSS